MELDRNDMNNKPTEYQVVNTGAGVTSNEVSILEVTMKHKMVVVSYDIQHFIYNWIDFACVFQSANLSQE